MMKMMMRVNAMTRVELIKQAIESAKCRIYKLNFDTNRELSAHHQKKAENQKDLMEITVEALEKQIPKKVEDYIENKEDYSSYYYLAFKCPSCKKSVISQPYRPKYCKHCGQAIDWSEE